MNIKRYLQIVHIVVLSLFHRSVTVVLKFPILKQRLQQRLVTFHASGGFLWHVFQKSGENLRSSHIT